MNNYRNKSFTKSWKLSYLIWLFNILICCQGEGTDEIERPTPTIEIEEETTTNNDINYNESLTLNLQQEPSSDSEANRLGRSFGIADFTPTGIYLKPEESLKITTQLNQGIVVPSVLIGTYARTVYSYEPQIKSLNSSIPITVTNTTDRDQMIYLRFVGQTLEGRATVTLEGGHKAPYFKLGETTNAEFIEMLDNYVYSEIQLQSENSIVLASKTTALKYQNQDWELLGKTLDEIIAVEASIDGLNPTANDINQTNRNRYLLTESEDERYWMAAWFYATLYNQVNAVDYLINVQNLINDGWGPWHELGHQHQLSNLTWNETTEVTVNIYSLAVERHFGHQSRLKRDGIWDKIQDFIATPITEKDYNSDALGPFERLCLYQQLWLHYGDSFFIDLHQKVREEGLSITGKNQKMGYFILKASEVTQNDLSAFFKEWGFSIEESYYEAVANLEYPQPSVDLTSLRE